MQYSQKTDHTGHTDHIIKLFISDTSKCTADSFQQCKCVPEVDFSFYSQCLAFIQHM